MITYNNENYYTYNELSESAKQNVLEMILEEFSKDYLLLSEKDRTNFNFSKINDYLWDNFDYSHSHEITKLCFDIENDKITNATVSFNIYGLNYLFLLEESDRQYFIDKYKINLWNSNKDNIDLHITMKVDFVDFTTHAQYFITNNFPWNEKQDELVNELMSLIGQGTPSVITEINEIARNELQLTYDNELEWFIEKASSITCNSLEEYRQLGDKYIRLYNETGTDYAYEFDW